MDGNVVCTSKGVCVVHFLLIITRTGKKNYLMGLPARRHADESLAAVLFTGSMVIGKKSCLICQWTHLKISTTAFIMNCFIKIQIVLFLCDKIVLATNISQSEICAPNLRITNKSYFTDLKYPPKSYKRPWKCDFHYVIYNVCDYLRSCIFIRVKALKQWESLAFILLLSFYNECHLLTKRQLHNHPCSIYLHEFQ